MATRYTKRFMIWLFMLVMVLLPSPAKAQDPVEVGYRDHSYPSGTGGNSEVTAEKPESKLWWNDGFWWGSLWSTSGNAYHIYRLDLALQDWIDTGTELDDRSDTKADVLWDETNQKLYVVSHIWTEDGTATPAGQRGELFRYSYNSATDTYTLDMGFPVEVTGGESEALVLTKDSTGILWVTYIEDQQVMVNHSLNGADSTWGAPFVLPNAAGVTSDDISSIVAFDGKIGIMWSDQNSPMTMYFAVHQDGASDQDWQSTAAYTVSDDDHLNLKSLESDSAGNVFAVIKTSKSSDLIVLLVCTSGTDCSSSSDWTDYPVYDGTYGPTRPILLIDTDNRDLYVFTWNKDPNDNNVGGIYYKTTDLDNIAFSDGIGVPFIKSLGTSINDPTSTKQNVNIATGLVVLASSKSSRRYYHNYLDLGGGNNPPVAHFTGAPTSGEAPLTVNVTDQSTGSPTSWNWDFGDGGTSTEQNPAHIYNAPGSYMVTLTVTNTWGTDSETKFGYIVVTSPPPVAEFTGDPTTSDAPLTVSFSDLSTGDPTEWAWDFGDGATSNERNPAHTYSAPGKYTVTLTVSNTAGGDTEVKPDYISVTWRLYLPVIKAR